MIKSRGSPLPTLPVLPPRLLPHRALPAPIGLGAPRGGQPERLDEALDAGLGEMSGMAEAAELHGGSLLVGPAEFCFLRRHSGHGASVSESALKPERQAGEVLHRRTGLVES